MKVIFDTNVFISAVWRDRTPEAVIVWVVDQPGWQWVVQAKDRWLVVCAGESGFSLRNNPLRE
jgi:hypothetical protein